MGPLINFIKKIAKPCMGALKTDQTFDQAYSAFSTWAELQVQVVLSKETEMAKLPSH